MHRSRSSATECRPAVRAAGVGPVQLLLPAAGRARRESALAAAAGRALPGVPLLRQPSFRRGVGPGVRPAHQSQTHPGWQLSNTLDAGFCCAALEAALRRGQPEIFNTAQGPQFTARQFLEPLQQRSIRISMDGRGRALDNAFIERLWRSVNDELI